MSDLISKLCERYTLHTHPDVATTVERSLVQLSRGIYTEEERFIFELLQNAVDSYNETEGCLEIQIVLNSNYLAFMHNGSAFSERDVIGICDVGNGNKTRDIKKIGYKGIGFKSVFMRSKCVTVKSGKYCFKFDKKYWDGYWDNNWDEQKYGSKNPEMEYEMPWQITPVKTTPPINIDNGSWNVITYIETEGEKNLAQKITKLMKNPQFLLFLKNIDIHMSFVNEGVLVSDISKNIKNGIVHLASKGRTISRWLTHTNENIVVPSNILEKIAEDINTPEKLKGVKSFDLSFAIAIEKNGRVRKIKDEESVIYTYLPTSYKFGDEGLPFLVNANFITDAGRQQLHKDSEWNKYIFSKIPSEYLGWISELSDVYENYFEVLPEKSYGTRNELEKAFAYSMTSAIEKIAFIPNANDKTIKIHAKNAIMDSTGISNNISKESFIAHVNRKYQKNLSEENIIRYFWKSIRILSDYGVFVFNKNMLQTIFDDNNVFGNITIDYDLKLINYLWKYSTDHEKEDDELLRIISKTNFILAEDGSVQSPCNMHFPNKYREENELAADVIVMNNDLYEKIDNEEIVRWLEKIGVNELSNATFIKYLFKNDYVTKENALEIGKFLFETSKEENFFNYPELRYDIKYIKFLTKEGNLKDACDLYLGSFYKPEFDIESIFDDDIYVSEDYCGDGNIAEWKVFLLKIGINEDLAIHHYSMKVGWHSDKENERYDYEFFENAKKASERYGWISWEGFTLSNADYGFCASKVYYYSFPFIDKVTKYNFAKLVFSRVFTKFSPEDINSKEIYVSGGTGMFSRVVDSGLLKNINCDVNHFKWIIDNCKIIPTVKKTNYKAKNVYSNAIPQIKDIAGDYLPVIDVLNTIPENWQTYLHLKTFISFEDYLAILTGISNDEERCEENKKRAALVYKKIVESGALDSEENISKLKEWSENNKILTQDGKLDFPKNMAYVTVDGFSSKSQVYTDADTDEEVIRLLRILGTDIIDEDSITPSFTNKQECDDFKNLLSENVSYIALMAVGKNGTSEDYERERVRIGGLLLNLHFFNCKSIKLTLGSYDVNLHRHTFCHDNNFYYVGEINPCVIEVFTGHLCNYLGLNNKDRELFMVLLGDNEDILENFKDKGYDVSLMKGRKKTLRLDVHAIRDVQDADNTTYFKGCIIIYEKLKALGYSPSCPSIFSSEEDSEVINIGDCTYHCYRQFEKYDITFNTHNGSEMLIRVMATKHQKEYLEHLPLSTDELEMINECDDSKEKSFVIANITGIDTEQQIIYLFKAHTLK